MFDDAERVAVAACTAGGAYLRTQFGTESAIDGTYDAHDVKAAADRASEERMLPVVRAAFPDHRIYAEESGEICAEESGEPPAEDSGGRAGADYRWILDPLDGTNNFTAGMASFATVAALQRGDTPILASIYVPMLDDRYVARRGEGVRFNGQRIRAESDVPPEAGTFVFVIGHGVKQDAERAATAERLRDALGDCGKRVVESWSPAVHWGLLARGRMEGIVTYRADEEEQVAGELLAEESGMATERDGPLYLAACDEATLDRVREAVAAAGGIV